MQVKIHDVDTVDILRPETFDSFQVRKIEIRTTNDEVIVLSLFSTDGVRISQWNN